MSAPFTPCLSRLRKCARSLTRSLSLSMSQYEKEFYRNAPYSPKFPQQNQTNHCWAAYVQHKIALKKYGEGSKDVLKYKALYTTMCPHSWVRLLCPSQACSRPLSPSIDIFSHNGVLSCEIRGRRCPTGRVCRERS